jgi:hypothetical protein
LRREYKTKSIAENECHQLMAIALCLAAAWRAYNVESCARAHKKRQITHTTKRLVAREKQRTSIAPQLEIDETDSEIMCNVDGATICDRWLTANRCVDAIDVVCSKQMRTFYRRSTIENARRRAQATHSATPHHRNRRYASCASISGELRGVARRNDERRALDTPAPSTTKP